MKHLVSFPINPILNVKHASIDTIARNGTWNCCQAPNTAPASLQLPALCKMRALCSYVPMCATHRNLCNDALFILCKYVQVQGRKAPSTASVLFNWPHCAKCVQLLNTPMCANVPLCSIVCQCVHCVPMNRCVPMCALCSILCILCNSLCASLNTNLCYDALCILCKYVQGGPIQNKICRTGRDMHDI